MKAVIVGCGNIGAVHAESIRRLEGVSLCAAADIRPERAASYAEKYGCRAYASLEEMLEKERPDVLHICTPHYLHVPMTAYALQRGIHVFCEKPPVISEEQLDALTRATAEGPGRAGFCFQNRYNPGVLFIRELLASGRLGKVKGARGIVTWNRGEAYYTQSGWRGRLETEGGGALINQSIHTMDLLGVFLGKPVSVEAQTANHHLPGVIEVEDMMEAYIRYADAAACFYATTAYTEDAPPLIELSCEKGIVRMEDPEVTIIWPDGRREHPETVRKQALGKSYWGSGHLDCIADFYRCLRTGERFAQELDGVRDTVRLMLAAYRSAAKGGNRETL
ncbi:MAG TPA: Gfo/Idh/MocA family oxidoreductase [Candidatus Eisenbergiella pullistercoris]|uniref:Gfo/Idh/MocA family oxidoreductase n=1 Tax=Candidatus Eisenbergiella pullistercoris TaxID=2838555 RepID=A0A9D2C747_9FIRM|nr:Gfo/Idh/MocA family oxidoreductase [Candidatus Eisenbergiella pullistercoris]